MGGVGVVCPDASKGSCWSMRLRPIGWSRWISRISRRGVGLTVLGVAAAIVVAIAVDHNRERRVSIVAAPPPPAAASTPATSVPVVATTIVAPTSTADPGAEMQVVPTTVQVAPPGEPAPVAKASAAPAAEKACVVRMHGKGGGGAATVVAFGISVVRPTGNANGWGGRQWLYEVEGDYRTARGVVVGAVDDEGCTRVIIDGFSNGAAFAAKLYCRGETFGGRLASVIIDDPVTDHAVEGCAPARAVAVTLYWTGALAGQSQPGASCAPADWTCAGGSTIGIDAYAAALRTPIKQSPMTGHTPYPGPPELIRF